MSRDIDDLRHPEWTTPANPTGQIATTPAVLSPEPPIVPTSGTKRVPDDSEAAYDWRLDLHLLDRRARDKYEEGDGYETDRLAAYIVDVESERDSAYELYSVARAYIERLEAERDVLRDKLESGHWLSDDEWYAGERANADFLRQYNALLAEHEMWVAFVASGRTMNALLAFEAAHDNAERVIHGE